MNFFLGTDNHFCEVKLTEGQVRQALSLFLMRCLMNDKSVKKSVKAVVSYL